MPRFVILHHVTPQGALRPTHWDLMFERGDVLRTWALSSEPDGDTQGDAVKLADHRLAYLEFEGPLGNERGAVSRWDEGDYQLEDSSPGLWRAVLDGSRLQARVELRQLGADDYSWRVSFGAAPRRG